MTAISSEYWKEIEDIYHAALERTEDQRAPFLEAACSGNDDLRREVESLLAANDQATGFLGKNALGLEAAVMDEAPTIAPIAQSFSHYRILSPIGAGGMGEVWLALDTNLDRRVAIKLLPIQFNFNTERLQRFVREAKAASALNHPNIITIYEIGEITTPSGKTRFIATEYIEGVTLRKRISDGLLGQSEALNIAIQIASALDAAHQAGIVHRDIKPENIMVRPDGLVKVLDFGLAKLAQPPRAEVNSAAPTIGLVKTEAGTVMGTVAYMSPEQARGYEVDLRSDIFSFGILLYEMVGGARPFTGATASDVIASILKTDPSPLPEDAPDELQRIVGKALQKEADARYQSAKGIEQDLKDLKRLSESGALPSVSSLRGNQSSQSYSTAVPATSPISLHSAQGSPWFKHRAGLALLLAGLLGVIAAIAYFATRPQEIDSIAVMPLEYAGGDAELEYLADGLTESLINNLSQLPKLRVLSRSAVFRYKGQRPDIEQVASQLRARAIITGRIVRRGDRLEISLELEDTKDHRHIWGDQYNKSVNDLLAMQSSVAKVISVNLRSQLSDAQKQQVAKHYTEDSEAYRLYLQGLFYQNKSTEAGLDESVKYFQQAIDKDTNYALAYAALANSYIMTSSIYRPSHAVIPLSREKARKAVELDETLAEGHA
ncbi:MAG: protein kinase domain-containing protein, partial [Blastocatellia bacterium]